MPPIESFEDMNLDAKVMLDIKFHEFDKPTPIQAQAIPIIRSAATSSAAPRRAPARPPLSPSR